MSSLRDLLRPLVAAGLVAALVVPASPASAEPTVAELTRQIDKSSTELARVVETYNELREKIKENERVAAGLQARIAPLEEQTARSRADVGEIAVTAYKTGGLQTVDALLSPGGSGSLAERLGTLDQLTRQRQARIAGFTANQRRLVEQQRSLDTTLARQAAQAKQVAAGKKKIEKDLARLYELRRTAYGAATEKPARKAGSAAKEAPAVSGKAGVAVRYAYGAIGKPYVWAADGPNGYDCSGLTSAAWRAAGRSLPHNTKMQWNAVAKISRSELRPGDLVFYRSLGHVALYVGDGQVIHAPTFGRHVEKRSVDLMPPYGYGRVR
ncbi:glycoside hydrolase [Micromonospora rosaria]|uniref:Glycoside hydrolase n=1 Tax=Micromonospora rosaria TaxID=47874 RepID=A0A136PIQ6_9ACTN|nr:C40 family peptidase [Micromonospora rosaria]KXK58295.1 glycoside hydrolase [Micromonospora rosaria]